MTPFGKKVREMRATRGIALKAMAHEIGVSPAYLSALEHGHRGKPTWYLVQKIVSFFNVIWDEAEDLERLAQISDPRVTLYTAGLNPAITEVANILEKKVKSLSETEARTILDILAKVVDRSSA